ncbi:MAG: hypothetical protein V7647_4183 [Acidobacteriota bacterium]|jgi:asparagine synthase (glutamine-hydrolysing)
MSGVFGCWQAGRQPANRAELLACIGRIGPHGAAGIRHWTEGGITLAQISSPRACLNDPNLSAFASDNTACVFDGRLDNRQALCRTLDDHPLVQSGCADEALIIAAYDRFGDTFVEHLDGDFALGVFDRRLNRLLVARDRLGLRPLCYARTGGTFLFASNAKTILAYPGFRAVPDEAMLADSVLSFISSDAETRTFFDGIRSLPPAHMMMVTPEGLTVRRYFEFDTRRQLRLRSWQDYVDAFHRLFTASVADRLRSTSPVAIAVSGGLDSAYIFCVAQRRLREANAPCPAVLGFNYAGRPGTPSDESGFVLDLERACGVPIARIAQRPGFIEAARDSVWHTESAMIDGLACQAAAGLRAMRDAGAGRLLTGHWGDQMLGDSDYLFDLLRSGRLRLLKQHLRGWGVSTPRFAMQFGRAMAARHIPPSIKLAARNAGKPADAVAWKSPWFTRRFQQILLERATFAPLRRPPGGSHAAALYRQSRLGYHVQCMEWNHRTALMHDIDIAFPYLDCELIQFLMAIPGDVQSRDGVSRGLMRAAMRRIVPDSIVDRRNKGQFTHLTNETIELDFSAVAELLGPSALSVQFGYVEGSALRKALGEWRTGARTVGSAMLANRMTGLCGFELLLRNFFAGEGAGRVASVRT